jgi:hypothetical protein
MLMQVEENMDGDDEYLRVTNLEIAKLRDQLSASPIYQRLKMLERHVLEYRALAPNIAPKAVVAPHPIKDLSRYGRSGSRAAVIVQAAEAYLNLRKSRAQSADIVQALVEAGIDLPTEKASAFVASYLSNSPLFDNERGKGYGLVEWKQIKMELA